jgi:hypothetical protein
MAKISMIVKSQRTAEVFESEGRTAAGSADALAAICGSSALQDLLPQASLEGYIPGVTKASW